MRRLSICTCGFPVLDDSVPVGTVYLVDPRTIRSGYRYRCGGCGWTQTGVTVVDALSVLNPAAEPRPLPYDLFVSEARQ
jgi:hypothetical protein